MKTKKTEMIENLWAKSMNEHIPLDEFEIAIESIILISETRAEGL